MNRCAALQLFAAYNASMNEKVYAAASRLSEDDLRANKGAFFGSVLATLNHIIAGDTIWLKRFAQFPFATLAPMANWPMPSALDEIEYADFAVLLSKRREMDQLITTWTAQLTEEQLDQDLAYHTMAGGPAKRNLYGLTMHFFNHQTHHRGQVTTLLTQMGHDVGVTDLTPMIPESP